MNRIFLIGIIALFTADIFASSEQNPLIDISANHHSLQLEFADDEEIVIQTEGGEMHLRRYREAETSGHQNIITQNEQTTSESEVASNEIIINGGKSNVGGSQDNFTNKFWLENICGVQSNIEGFTEKGNEILVSKDHKIKSQNETTESEPSIPSTESSSSIEIGENLFIINMDLKKKSDDDCFCFVNKSNFGSSILSNFDTKYHFEEYKILNSAKNEYE